MKTNNSKLNKATNPEGVKQMKNNVTISTTNNETKGESTMTTTNNEITLENADINALTTQVIEQSKNPFIDIHEIIDNIDFNKTNNNKQIDSRFNLSPEMSATLRDILHTLADITKKVGKVVVNIGKQIILGLINFCKLCPNSACGLFLYWILGECCGHIPIISWVLRGITFPIRLIILIRGIAIDLVGSETVKKFFNNLIAKTGAAQ